MADYTILFGPGRDIVVSANNGDDISLDAAAVSQTKLVRAQAAVAYLSPGTNLAAWSSTARRPELFMGWVDPWVGSRFFIYWRVGFCPQQQMY